MTKLDYTIESLEERKALVEKIVAENSELSANYLEVLADYLILCMEKQERKERKILTENRLTTVNKRECSFEGLVGKLENGEDGIYSLINENKNTILQPKISITQYDLDTIPCLKQLREAIKDWEAALKRASGRQAFVIKRALIEMRKDQYIIKQAYQKPVVSCRLTHSTFFTPLDDKSYIKRVFCIDDNGYLNMKNELVVKGISLMDVRVVSAILCNYSRLKEDSCDQFNGDTWYLIQDFENTCDKALADFPIYQRIVELKIDKMQNEKIKEQLRQEFGTTYSIEYISNLWRKKIPKLIAAQAQEDFLTHEYKKRGYYMKKCSKCGQLKPAHNLFFSKNNTSKDFWYSICKKCRNKKRG